MTEAQSSHSPYQPLFSEFFQREVAKKAARSLTNEIGIEFRITPAGSENATEIFYFTRVGGINTVRPGTSPDPEVIFTLPPKAADQILAITSDEVGAIGVEIAKLLVTQDPEIKVRAKLRGGFFTLFSRGYLGVLKEGGGSFAAFLASKGLGGLDSIKKIIQKLKG